MYGAGHHKMIAQLLIQIASLSDDDAQIQTQGRLRQTPDGGKSYASPPSIELIPDSPSKVVLSGLQQLNGINAAHRRGRIYALSFKICRIVKTTRIKCPAWCPEFRANCDPIGLVTQSFRRSPRQSNHSRLIRSLHRLVKSDEHHHSIWGELDRRDNPSAQLLKHLTFINRQSRWPFNHN